MSLGENIYRLRSLHGLSQDALAEKLDVSRQSVSKWETDVSVPELEKLIRLAEVFDVTLDELVRDIRPGDAPAAPAPAPAEATSAVPAEPVRDGEGGGKSAKVGTGQLVAGTVLLVLGAVFLVLLTFLGGLVGALISIPFFVTGIICLRCKRRAGLWCAWTAYLFFSVYLRMGTGSSWNMVFSPVLYTTNQSPVTIAVSWCWLAVYVALVLITVRSFRDLRLSRTARHIAPLAGIVIFYFAIIPLLNRIIVQIYIDSAPRYSSAAHIATVVLYCAKEILIPTAIVLALGLFRKRKSK